MEPSDAEVIREAITSWLDGVHTSMPGSVVSYDPTTQTANVQPAVQRTTPRKSGGWAYSQFPIIPNVKVAWLSAGPVSLQAPLLPGDAVFLLFSEVCWAQYRKSGVIAPPGDMRRFDLSWPVALPVKLMGALRAVTGPHLEIPDGQALTVGGDPALCKAVAIAELIEAELNKIAQALATGTAGPYPVVFSSVYHGVGPGAVASDSIMGRPGAAVAAPPPPTPPEPPPTPPSLTAIQTLLNEIKADYNAHRASATFHASADGTNVVTSPDV